MKYCALILGCLTMMATAQAEKDQTIDLDDKEKNYDDVMKRLDKKQDEKDVKEEEKEKTNDIK